MQWTNQRVSCPATIKLLQLVQPAAALFSSCLLLHFFASIHTRCLQLPGLQDVVPAVQSGVTFLIPADTAFDSFFAKFDPATAQASIAATCCARL